MIKDGWEGTRAKEAKARVFRKLHPKSRLLLLFLGAGMLTLVVSSACGGDSTVPDQGSEDQLGQSQASANQEGAAAEPQAPDLQDEPTEVPDEGGVAEPETPAMESPGGDAPADTSADAEPPVDVEVPVEEATPPFRLTFAADEPIDVSPAVAFVDIASGEVTVWAIDDASPEFDVAPSGTYILWWADSTRALHLLRTDSGIDQVVFDERAWGITREFGPGDAGFVVDKPGSSGFSLRDTVIYNGHGRELLRLPYVDGSSFAWSPDGALLAQSASGVLKVFEIPLTASDSARTIIEFPSLPAELDWSPDGQKLASAAGGILRVFARDGALLWEFSGDRVDDPRWSPDGRLLRVHGAEYSTYLFDGTGALLQRAGDPNRCPGGRWLPDSSGYIYELLVKPGGAEQLPDGFRVPNSPVDGTLRWSGQRGEIVGTTDILLHNSSEGSTRVIAIVGGQGYHTSHLGGSWTSDGMRVVFTMPEAGHGGCES